MKLIMINELLMMIFVSVIVLMIEKRLSGLLRRKKLRMMLMKVKGIENMMISGCMKEWKSLLRIM